MPVVYIFVVAFVTALLLTPALLPFWKVVSRLKANYPKVWDARGPFNVTDIIAAPALLEELNKVIDDFAKDETVKKQDPQMAKWCNLALGIRQMLPKTFLGQVGYFFIFLYFTGFFTFLLIRAFQ